jgi:MEMO1 family protein
LRGIIGPHAGFYYSGPTTAWAYINIDPTKYRRVFLLGPSHHAYLSNCALTKSKYYETPLGNLEIDREITD